MATNGQSGKAHWGPGGQNRVTPNPPVQNTTTLPSNWSLNNASNINTAPSSGTMNFSVTPAQATYLSTDTLVYLEHRKTGMRLWGQAVQDLEIIRSGDGITAKMMRTILPDEPIDLPLELRLGAPASGWDLVMQLIANNNPVDPDQTRCFRLCDVFLTTTKIKASIEDLSPICGTYTFSGREFKAQELMPMQAWTLKRYPPRAWYQ